MVQRLEALAADRPIRFGVRIERLAPAGDGYALETDDGTIGLETMCVAGGQGEAMLVERLN